MTLSYCAYCGGVFDADDSDTFPLCSHECISDDFRDQRSQWRDDIRRNK